MKKRTLCTLFMAGIVPLLAACAPYDYTRHLSEVRSDLFLAQSEAFTLTLACVSREYPYADDGIACPMTDYVEISLVPTGDVPQKAEVYTPNGGGEASFDAVSGEYRYSEGVDAFPQEQIALTVVWGEARHEIVATSVKSEKTVSPQDALSVLVHEEREALGRMERENVFCGEFRIRLLRRDKNYYYAAVLNGETCIALLLDADTGEVLARREG